MRVDTPAAAGDDLDRLAGALHDGPLQVLHAVALDLQLAEHLLADGADPGPALAAARRQTQRAVDELRGLARALRAGGVAGALQALAHTVGPRVTCRIDGAAAELLAGARGVELVVAASTVVAERRRREGDRATLDLRLALDGDEVVLELAGDGIGDGEIAADLWRRASRLGGRVTVDPHRLALRLPA